ncbi:MAG TPA: hypothetical protein VGE37_11000, partial [Archangium sp.]
MTFTLATAPNITGADGRSWPITTGAGAEGRGCGGGAEACGTPITTGVDGGGGAITFGAGAEGRASGAGADA